MNNMKTHLFALMFQCTAFGFFATATGYFGFSIIRAIGMVWTLAFVIYHCRAILTPNK